MTQFSDYFKPEVLFSTENPIMKSAETAHRLVFEAADQVARAQLRFAENLLDLNRDRFELLYAGQSFSESLDAQQELMAEFGKRTVDYAGDMREAATTLAGRVSDVAPDAANGSDTGPKRKSASSKSKKAA